MRGSRCGPTVNGPSPKELKGRYVNGHAIKDVKNGKVGSVKRLNSATRTSPRKSPRSALSELWTQPPPPVTSKVKAKRTPVPSRVKFKPGKPRKHLAIQPFCPVEINEYHRRIHERCYGKYYKKVEKPVVDTSTFQQEEHLRNLDLISARAASQQPLSRLQTCWPRNLVGRTTAYDKAGQLKTRRLQLNSTPFSSAFGRHLITNLNAEVRDVSETSSTKQARWENQPPPANESVQRSSFRRLEVEVEPMCRLTKRGVVRPPQFATLRDRPSRGLGRPRAPVPKLPIKPNTGNRLMRKRTRVCANKYDDPKLKTAIVRVERLRTIFCEDCGEVVIPDYEDATQHACFNFAYKPAPKTKKASLLKPKSTKCSDRDVQMHSFR